MEVLAQSCWEQALIDQGADILYHYPSKILCHLENKPEGIPFSDYDVVSQTRVLANDQWVCIPSGEFVFTESPRSLLRFFGPFPSELASQFTNLNIHVYFYCHGFGACVKIPEHLKNKKLIRELPLLAGCVPYTAAVCSRQYAGEKVNHDLDVIAEDMLDLVTFSSTEHNAVLSKLAEGNIQVLETSDYKIRIKNNSDLGSLRKMTGVKIADPVRASVLCHTELPDAVGLPSTNFYGEGNALTGYQQVIAVADTGLDNGKNDDTLHGDFRNRVKAIYSWPLQNGWTEYFTNTGADDGPADKGSGHGTHVAGLALGNGARSGGRHVGIAAEAQLVFQAIEQRCSAKTEYRARIKSGYYLTGKPLDLQQLFLQAREQGARIHVNAWGDEAQGQYTDDCYECDSFLNKHSDAILLFAAGNSGADKDGNRVLDNSSLFAPASAKNVLAIGATEGGEQGVGLHMTWGQYDSSRQLFKNNYDRNDAISGEPDRIAMFSSTGPSRDGRIKPDLCAPGTNLAAARSQATSNKGWGLASPLPYYMYNGGTSMSVGVAGGAAAVIRQAWQDYLGNPPSGPALKALMIAGASPVISRKDDKPEPRNVAGFGRVLIQQSLPKQLDTHIELHDIIDIGLLSGEQHEYLLDFNGGHLRAVLCWYDLPGENLVNDLDLCLLDAHDRKLWGNHQADQSFSDENIGEPDRVNTVEVIDQKNLLAGLYRLRVTGFNVAQNAQTYALVIKHSLHKIADIAFHSIRGINENNTDFFEDKGIYNFQQLIQADQSLLDSLSLSHSRIGQLKAQLYLLKKQSISLEKLNLIETDFSLDTILHGAERPENFDERTWMALHELCLPLLLVFTKNALGKIKLKHLLT